MGHIVDKPDNCLRCERAFTEVEYHSSGKCRNCYNTVWSQNRDSLNKKQKTDHCVTCLSKWGSISPKGKLVKPASHSMCRMCYHRSYIKTLSSNCKRCQRDMGKKSKGHCPLCKIELDSMRSPGKRALPKIEKITIDKEVKESMRKLFNRYKFGTNTLVDPFVLTNIYLEVFSNENIKGETASKTEFNLEQFDEVNQVIAMLKLLKMVYDKS